LSHQTGDIEASSSRGHRVSVPSARQAAPARAARARL
jgi:hypothetical protein